VLMPRKATPTARCLHGMTSRARALAAQPGQS
jgi:hypothetical protein